MTVKAPVWSLEVRRPTKAASKTSRSGRVAEGSRQRSGSTGLPDVLAQGDGAAMDAAG